MRKSSTLLALLLATAPAAAASAPYGGHLRYEVYAAGIELLDVDVTFEIDADRYRIDIDSRTVGAPGLIFRSAQHTTAECVSACKIDPLRGVIGVQN